MEKPTYVQLLQATREEIANLNVEKAFALIDSYEKMASTVKGRTWTITAWILTINTGLIAFCFKLYKDNLCPFDFLIFEFVACLVGVVLCIFLEFLIEDQGNHLRGYWTRENQIGAWNKGISGLVFRSKDFEKKSKDDLDILDKVLQRGYVADFPKFCKRLQFLSRMFLVGFIGVFFLMWCLSRECLKCL